MNAEFFLDTSILVYTFDAENTAKQARARELAQLALRSGAGVVSFQVVQEFLQVATGRFPLPMTPAVAARYLRTVLAPLCLISSSITLQQQALDLQERFGLSFYDSLIVGAALQARCQTLYSEELRHGQKVETLSIVNPFL